MSRIIISAFLVCSLVVAIGQSQEVAPGDSIPWELRKQSFIYNAAKGFNDPSIVKMAIYNLIAENPSNVVLYDSLALIYLEYNENVSAALVAQQALRLNPKNNFATEIAAVSFENLGVNDKALSYYEKLYLSNSNIFTLYKMSFLQMGLERYAESENSLNIIIGDPQAKEVTVTFPTVDQVGQEVSLEIAAHRVKAMIEESKGNIEVAKEKYLEVLEMKPDLQIVQQQLRALTKVNEE